MSWLSPRRLMKVAAFTVLFVAISLVFAQNEPAAQKKTIDPQAQQVIKAMSDHYRSLKSLSLTADVDIARTFQGQKQEMSGDIAYALERPGKFSLSPAGDKQPRIGIVKSDGQTLTMYVPQLGKYTSEPAPAQLGQLFDNRVLDAVSLGSAGLVTALMSENPEAQLLDDVTEAKYVGAEKLDGVDTHRLRLANGQTAMDIWITAGDKPTLIRAVPDLSAEEARAKDAGQEIDLDMSLKLRDQQLNPALAEGAFAFNAPEGAEKVASFFEEPAHPMAGKEAPDFTLSKLEGGEVKLSSHEGKDVVILDFWATWCGPCVQAMPVIEEVAEAFKDKNVVLYAVNQREGADQIKKFLEARKLNVNVLLDTEGAAADAFGVRGIPHTAIIDKAGNVAAVHVGFSPRLKQQLTQELEKLTK